jgi:hypothetical protein
MSAAYPEYPDSGLSDRATTADVILRREPDEDEDEEEEDDGKNNDHDENEEGDAGYSE